MKSIAIKIYLIYLPRLKDKLGILIFFLSIISLIQGKPAADGGGGGL